MKTAFLDSSVVFSAVNSPLGGSSKLFTIKSIKLVSSPTVLTEVERNVRKKLQSFHLDRFFMLADQLIVIDQKPDPKLIEKAKSNFLVTLDQKHFLTSKAANFLKPQQILTPKMLIKKFEK